VNELQVYILNNGLKVTPQRLAILKYLRENRIHPTAEKIYNELIKEYPAISLTTVYNTLASFVEKGMVKELDVDPHKKRFDFLMDSHDHFHCRVCDNIFDIAYEAPIISDNLLNNKSIEGHRVDKVSISLKGVCKYCEAVV
jgi:Fur family transcriptional regulator, peroxide stress response regulator